MLLIKNQKATMKNTYVYDTEGTGLQTRYDRPYQFAANLYGSNDNLIQTTNLRGRLPRYVLPDPEALLITGQSIKNIQSAPLSHYEFVERVHADIVANSPATVMSYNGIRYDEEILRHTFYTNLRAPYVTQLAGNERMDILKVAKAVVGFNKDTLTVPLGNDGKRSFRLQGLAAANGFTDHNAHDALGDVEATMHLAQFMKRHAGRAWEACCRNQSKEYVLDLMRAGKPLVYVGWSYEVGLPNYQLIQPVTSDETNANEWLCVNLSADVDDLLEMKMTDLVQAFKPSLGTSSIVRVKANAAPMVFSVETAAYVGIELPDETRTAVWLLANVSFAERLKAAATARKNGFEQPNDVWNQLYTGGFFPVSADKSIIQQFHQATPSMKWNLIAQMTDPRAKNIARWLVGSEWPEVLSSADRYEIESEFRDHLTKPDAPWTTIPSALAKIKELLSTASGDEIEILSQYKQYLLRL